jgi:hypothetical protein
MIVDRDTLALRPIADELLSHFAGSSPAITTTGRSRGRTSWRCT